MEKAKKELLEKTYLEFMQVGLESNDPNLLDGLVDKDVMGFGTAIDEKILGIEEFKKLLIYQKNQSQGLELVWRNEPVHRLISEDENSAVYVEDVFLTILSKDGNLQMYLRFSVVFNFKDNQWKVVHWHGSKPEEVASKKDTWGIENWKQKAEELERLVAEKTADLVEKNRTLEIEAALERVRSMTMAMHSSADIGACILKMFEELTFLGVDEGTRFGIGILNHTDENNQLWTARRDGEEVKMHIGNLDMTSHPLLKKARKAWKEQVNFHYYILEGQDLLDYYQMLNQAPDYKIHIPLENLPKKEIQHCFIFEHGFFYAFSPNEFQPELIQITQRFSAQFAQTYQRYLDLVKAEAQAREAQIEAALERVRSRTMAMQSSDELSEAATEMFSQIKGLGLNPWSCGFNIFNEDKTVISQWVSTGDGRPIEPFDTPTTKDVFKQIVEHSEHDELLYIQKMEGKKLENTYKYMASLPTLDKIFEELDAAGIALPKSQVDHVAYFKHGYLMFITYEETPEFHSIFKRFAKVFEQTYTRFLDLKKAEAQAKEARIEAALERVRSRTMGMQKAEELGEVAIVLFSELNSLVDNLWTCGFVLCEKDRKEDEWWLSLDNGLIEPFSLPNVGDYAHESLYEGWEKGDSYRTVTLEDKQLQQHYDWLMKIPIAEKIFEEMESSGIPRPNWQRLHAAYFKTGYLVIITEVPCEEEEIFKRFAQVFDLTYTRFLDLQKAEAQAREARVELSLERIRAHVTAMKESSELFDIVVAMRKEFITLGHEADYFWHMKWTEKSYEMSMTSEEGDRIGMVISIPKFVHDDIPRLAEWEKSDSDIIALDLNGPEAWDYIDKMNTYGKYEQVDPHAPTEEDILAIGGLTFVIARTTHGEIGYSLAGQVPSPPQESLETLIRFAKVFGIAYKRFEDLKKAEEQTREAKIELSLERIRAQVTAMRESEELLEIMVNMRKEFVNLGHEAHYFWHMRWLPDTYAKAMTSGDGSQIGMVMSLPRRIHGDIPAVAAWEKGTEPTHILAMDIDLAVDYVDKMIKLGDFERVDPQAPTLDDIRQIGGLTFVMARTTHGEIGYSLPGKVEHPPQESIDTLTRFAGVFDLAYRRFEDLLTAEKQNRKAKIELALERVRARAMAMQEPEELVEVAQVLREEMGLLGVEELETSSIYINQGEQGKAQCWYSIKDIRDGAKTYVSDHFDLNYRDTWVGNRMLDFFQSDLTDTSILMQGDNRIEWINYCAKRTKKLDGYYGNEIPERTYHLTKFSNGAIGAATPGEISTESWELLQRAATVFSLAYSRFRDLSKARDDLKKLKRAKAKAEKALKELKSAQEQLIQQEKLASLGQLTAGIAHEIKNPLNFVNNFSDLSRELIDEVFLELENIEDSGVKEEITAILNDVKSNLTKVYEHGSRADSIVTSMLQHSRASSSKREAKAFNPLVKEFVNLSYHGMRAGKAPINVDIDFQLDSEVGEVSLITEDFSRVILNLCNNAFDAMRDKLKTENGRPETEAYLPKLTVKSVLQKEKVILSIADNGGGIPADIKDKILQPFFTTKKGTEGTGLGLSITHDIIKAHGGELKVESKGDQGAIFLITLPLS